MNLYVSNLAYSILDPELRAAFETYGAVTSARVITDRESGRSRGFGFVEMANDPEATAAINSLNGQDLGGRPIKVVEARPKEERPGGGGGGGGRSFGGGGGGGGGGYRDGGGGGGGGGGGRRDGGGGGGGRSWDRGDRGRSRGGESDGW
ncbi:MAG: RNA-binding protein [Verrucomicrobiaceae bacterium]|nr:RNA-binding protein [Verrucomicrobiaceae bacterium]